MQNPKRANNLKRTVITGALWVTITSAAAVPLALYRNWILGTFGADASVLGNYAIVLLFIGSVSTFALFGGSSVVTNFLPKIKNDSEKAAFLLTYGTISIVACTAFSILLFKFPSLTQFLLRGSIDGTSLKLLTVLAPIVVMAQLLIFSLSGLMEFRLVAVLAQAQLIFTCTFATVAWFFFPNYVVKNSILTFVLVVGIANIFIIIIAISKVCQSLQHVALKFYLPQKFWKFSSFVHLNTVSTFAYQSIDQLVVLTQLGTSELGAYFVLLQLTQLISFVPQRIGQVMLATFSRMVANDNQEGLSNAYQKLCRAMLVISTPMTLLLMTFSHPIAKVFGPWLEEHYSYLVILAAAVYIGALGSVNSMLILSKERTGLFLLNSVVLLITQIGVTFAFIDDMGLYAVILGKGAAILVGQMGLLAIIKWAIRDIQFRIPFEYSVGLLTVVGTAIFAARQPLSLGIASGCFTSMTAVFLITIRFRTSEVREIIARKKPILNPT